MAMNGMLTLGIVAGSAIAVGAAVRVFRKRRANDEERELDLDIARFENEGGRTAPV